MLLLDRNNEPSSTVYYLSAAVYERVGAKPGVTASTLYKEIVTDVAKREITYDFFVMALDFLFLLDRIKVDKKGGLHANQIAAD